MSDLDDDNEDLDDDGSEDVQWYPLPDSLMRKAEELLGADEVERLLGDAPPKKDGPAPAQERVTRPPSARKC